MDFNMTHEECICMGIELYHLRYSEITYQLLNIVLVV